MTKRAIALLVAAPVLGMAALTGALMAQTPQLPAVAPVTKADLPGRTIFEHQCAPCHGAGPGDDGVPMLPGTMVLARRYQGDPSGALELRDDLDGEILRLFVRNGVGAMPGFRKAELSDADIDAIAEYLAATAQASRAANRR